MREITSIEISRVLDELRGKLEGSRLRKFYDFGEGSFRILFYKKEGNVQIYCKLLGTFNETKFIEPADEASTFAMGIRKRIENSRVTSLKQHDSDRMIIIEFSTDGYRLIIEMFGKGNVILINSSGVIEQCYKTIRYRDRSVAPGNHYEFPKGNVLPIDKLDKDTFRKILDDAPPGKKLIRHLSDIMNIGPIYLEDIIRRSGLEPGVDALALDENSKDMLVSQMLLFSEREKAEKPRIYLEEGIAKDYSIVDVVRYKGLESREYENLNELLDDFWIEPRMENADTAMNSEKRKIEASLEAQKQLVRSAMAESEYYSKAGMKIFEKMQEINMLIEYLKKNRNAKLDEVRGVFPHMNIRELELKNKTVKIEIED